MKQPKYWIKAIEIDEAVYNLKKTPDMPNFNRAFQLHIYGNDMPLVVFFTDGSSQVVFSSVFKKIYFPDRDIIPEPSLDDDSNRLVNEFINKIHNV